MKNIVAQTCHSRHTHSGETRAELKRKALHTSTQWQSHSGKTETIIECIEPHTSSQRQVNTRQTGTAIKRMFPHTSHKRHVHTGQVRAATKSIIRESSDSGVDDDVPGATRTARISLVAAQLSATLIEGIARYSSNTRILHHGGGEKPSALEESQGAHTRHRAGDEEIAPQPRALVEGLVSYRSQGGGQ